MCLLNVCAYFNIVSNCLHFRNMSFVSLVPKCDDSSYLVSHYSISNIFVSRNDLFNKCIV